MLSAYSLAGRLIDSASGSDDALGYPADMRPEGGRTVRQTR
jgi:hypothetical protein